MLPKAITCEELELLRDESVVAQLVDPSVFIRHRNHVAMVTDQRLVFLKKKTVGAYYEIEYIPTDASEHGPPPHRGFLTWFLLRLFHEDDSPPGSSVNPSSGEEVEEDVIEY